MPFVAAVALLAVLLATHADSAPAKAVSRPSTGSTGGSTGTTGGSTGGSVSKGSPTYYASYSGPYAGVRTPYTVYGSGGSYYSGSMGYRRAPVFIGGFFFYPAAALYYRDGTVERCNTTSARQPPPTSQPLAGPNTPPAAPQVEQQFNNLTYVLTSNTSFAEFDALNSSLFNSTGYFLTDCEIQQYGAQTSPSSSMAPAPPLLLLLLLAATAMLLTL
ncbi:hypothetical protein V8C86DRAFT_2734508 [Haematococcus lacustris]